LRNYTIIFTMKLLATLLLTILLFIGCSIAPKNEQKKPQLIKKSFTDLPNFNDANFTIVKKLFVKNCKTKKAKTIYGKLCQDVPKNDDAKAFFTQNFNPYMLTNTTEDSRGLLTGYYEASIHASHKPSKKYKYPIYTTPKDLIMVDLSPIYPSLKQYRLRGRIVGNKLVPYYDRHAIKKREINASVLCYCDSPIDRFFLEVQGSGIAKFEDNRTIYIGYANQNGHRYRSIGRYLIHHHALKPKEVSLQSIRKWLLEHPKKMDQVLNYNRSVVFFSKKTKPATGALGVVLTPMHSIAVDKKYIPLGSMLYLHADANSSEINKIVFAQDRGGAIKGPVRADLFVGSGKKALAMAGRLKAPLKLWILLPKKERNE